MHRHRRRLEGARICPTRRALVGRGVYYGAARTEALNTRGLDIFMIGGGNSAGQAAMFFANYARTVTLIVRGPSLERSMSQYLIDQLASRPNIRVESRSQVVALEGTDRSRRRSSSRTARPAAASTRQTEALFVFIGADAETAWLPQEIIRDERDYLCIALLHAQLGKTAQAQTLALGKRGKQASTGYSSIISARAQAARPHR